MSIPKLGNNSSSMQGETHVTENSNINLSSINKLAENDAPSAVPLSVPDSAGLSSIDAESKSDVQNKKVVDLQHRLEDLSKLSIDFIALLSTSTIIATFGLFQSSAAVIIGAMIIAPLMRPLVGLALAILTSDLLLLRRAALTVLCGTITGVSIAAGLALVLHQIELTPEILARTKPTLLDLGIAFFAGAIGAYCQTKRDLADSLAGVAIAVALVPPLSVVGVGLALGQTELWQGAALLYLTNLVGITIAGALVFFVMGYATLKVAKHGLLVSCAVLALLVVPLGFSMSDMILENRLSSEIKQILKEKTYTFKNVNLREIELKRYRIPNVVIATVFTDQQITSTQVRLVQELLIRELNMPLELRLKVVPLTEITAQEAYNKSQAPIESSHPSESEQSHASNDGGLPTTTIPPEIDRAATSAGQ